MYELRLRVKTKFNIITSPQTPIITLLASNDLSAYFSSQTGAFWKEFSKELHKILTWPQLSCGVTALRAFWFLDVIWRSSTSTTQGMCLITTFTKAWRTLRLKNTKKNPLINLHYLPKILSAFRASLTRDNNQIFPEYNVNNIWNALNTIQLNYLTLILVIYITDG